MNFYDGKNSHLDRLDEGSKEYSEEGTNSVEAQSMGQEVQDQEVPDQDNSYLDPSNQDGSGLDTSNQEAPTEYTCNGIHTESTNARSHAIDFNIRDDDTFNTHRSSNWNPTLNNSHQGIWSEIGLRALRNLSSFAHPRPEKESEQPKEVSEQFEGTNEISEEANEQPEQDKKQTEPLSFHDYMSEKSRILNLPKRNWCCPRADKSNNHVSFFTKENTKDD